jgi:hypothetical protein
MTATSDVSDMPEYEKLALALAYSIHERDQLAFDRAVSNINRFGWHRGVMHSINYAVVTMLSLSHVGGLNAEFSSDFIAGWQKAVSLRHGDWLLVPDDLVHMMILRTKNGPEAVGDVPLTIVAIRQVMLFETMASILSNGAERDFETVLEASFLKAREVIAGFVRSGELRLEE